MATMTKKEVLKILEANKISNFQTPEDKIKRDLQIEKFKKREKQEMANLERVAKAARETT